MSDADKSHISRHYQFHRQMKLPCFCWLRISPLYDNPETRWKIGNKILCANYKTIDQEAKLYYTLCLKKKFPPLNSLQLCQILTDFQNLCTAGKRVKFATTSKWHCQPHFKHVATLPWEIKNSNFLQIFNRYGRKCKQIAF